MRLSIKKFHLCDFGRVPHHSGMIDNGQLPSLNEFFYHTFKLPTMSLYNLC